MATELINTPGQVRFYRGPWNAYWSTKPSYNEDTQTYDFTKADINKKYINAIYFITDTDDHVGELYLNGKICVYHDTLTSRTLTHDDIININIAGTTGGEELDYTHQTILKNGDNTQTLGNALLQMAIDLTWHDVASEGGGTIAVNTGS